MASTDEKNNHFISENITIDTQNNIIEEKVPRANFRFNSRMSMTKKIKKDYHEQRLGQSKWAFWLSFYGSIAGFIVIVISIVVGFFIGNTQWPGIVAGVIVDAASVLVYGLSNRANEKISEFFKELTNDDNIEKAIELANEISDTNIKDELKVKLSLHLSGISEDKICKNTKTVCKQNEMVKND